MSDEVIKILPHHAMKYFDFHFLGTDPSEDHSWYSSEKMENKCIDQIHKVLGNTNQLVQIVSRFDDWCRFCPKNKSGENYDPMIVLCEKNETTEETENKHEDYFAVIIGLSDVLNSEPITSQEFFDKMRPTYDSLIYEPKFFEQVDPSKRGSLRQILRTYGFPSSMRMFDPCSNSLIKLE